jgi:hypothetical protein
MRGGERRPGRDEQREETQQRDHGEEREED